MEIEDTNARSWEMVEDKMALWIHQEKIMRNRCHRDVEKIAMLVEVAMATSRTRRKLLHVLFHGCFGVDPTRTHSIALSYFLSRDSSEDWARAAQPCPYGRAIAWSRTASHAGKVFLKVTCLT